MKFPTYNIFRNLKLSNIHIWGRVLCGFFIVYKSIEMFSFSAIKFLWSEKLGINPKLAAALLFVGGIYCLWPLLVKLHPKNIMRPFQMRSDEKRIDALVERSKKRPVSRRPFLKNYRYSASASVVPLGLDLKSFSGGGAFPSQYWGETHEGLKIYGRYRHGTMEVRVAGRLETNSEYYWKSLLDASLGSQYDGFISLTQFCEIAGITVMGEIPQGEHSAEELASEHDLTGAMVFYEFYVDCTLETQGDILDSLFSWDNTTIIERGPSHEPGEGVIICPSKDHITQSYVKIIIGPKPTPSEIIELDKAIVSSAKHTVVNFDLSKKENVMRGYGQHELTETVSSDVGRSLSVANYGNPPPCPYGRISISGNYKNNNSKAEADIARIDSLYEFYFPKQKRIWVNLLTRKIHSEEFMTADKRFSDWVDPKSDQWLHLQWSSRRSDNIPLGAYLAPAD